MPARSRTPFPTRRPSLAPRRARSTAWRRDDGVPDLAYAQLGFFGFLLLDALITHEGFVNNHGPSYYGGHWQTTVPYALGVLSAGVLSSSGAPRYLVRVRTRPLFASLLAVQFTAGLVAMFSQLDVLRFLSTGIAMYQLAFGTLAVLAVRELTLEP